MQGQYHFSLLIKGVTIGDKVSVFADLLGHCKRGWNKEYEGQKYFVGNGLLLQNRQDLFTTEAPRYNELYR
jgi:hypothetical protein